MLYLVAIFFPWLSFFLIGKIFQGFLCLFLQLTVIGWLPATIWALFSVSNHHADKRSKELLRALQQQHG